MLTSRQPIWIGWGRDLVFFYNDPYKSIIGGKHPVALGQPTRSRLAGNLARHRAAARFGAHGRRRNLRQAEAPHHGAQRLSRRNVLHLLLQPDPRRRRQHRRHHLRQQRRHGARRRRTATDAPARTRGIDARRAHLARSVLARHPRPRDAIRTTSRSRCSMRRSRAATQVSLVVHVRDRERSPGRARRR